MSHEHIAQLWHRIGIALRTRMAVDHTYSCQARIVLGLFLVNAVLLAVHTALTAKDASLHLKLQHRFHNAQVLVWVDSDLAYSGRVTGSRRKDLA